MYLTVAFDFRLIGRLFMLTSFPVKTHTLSKPTGKARHGIKAIQGKEDDLLHVDRITSQLWCFSSI